MEGAAKNPDLYNNQKNGPFRDRLIQSGMGSSALEMLMQNGEKDPDWYLKNKEAGRLLEAVMNAANVPVPRPAPDQPARVPDRTPAPDPYLRKSPFA